VANGGSCLSWSCKSCQTLQLLSPVLLAHGIVMERTGGDPIRKAFALTAALPERLKVAESTATTRGA
jgi:hypothetical protein